MIVTFRGKNNDVHITGDFEFAKATLDTKQTDELIGLLQKQKALAEVAHGSYIDMALGDLEDHPF